jgi:Ni2+-binding GTPase involved in maturation of urease and hydrogenase
VKRLGIPTIGGISGYLCPDHYFISNMEESIELGKTQNAEYLFIETAGLCLRCAPHIEGVLAVTIVDCLSGIQAPEKMGPMLSLADVVVLTKGDLVSQAEREVIRYSIRNVNPEGTILLINGLMGTGTLTLVQTVKYYH